MGVTGAPLSVLSQQRACFRPRLLSGNCAQFRFDTTSPLSFKYSTGRVRAHLALPRGHPLPRVVNGAADGDAVLVDQFGSVLRALDV